MYYLLSAEANQSTSAFNINKQYRIMSPFPVLREVCPYYSFCEENIKDNDNLILVSPETIKFSQTMKTSHIYLENKRKSATKLDVDDIEYCLCEPGLKYGRIYLEFILESEPIEKNIIIGLSTSRTSYQFNNSKQFFGFILSDCQLVFNLNDKIEKREYGCETKIGDKIGMLIELSRSEREVTFYVNNVSCGIAFRDLPIEKLYPCVSLGFPGTRIGINSKIDFPPMQ